MVTNGETVKFWASVGTTEKKVFAKPIPMPKSSLARYRFVIVYDFGTLNLITKTMLEISRIFSMAIYFPGLAM
jgi:hypothetical protein